MHQEVTIQNVLDVMNALLAKDRITLSKLLTHRVTCNEAWANAAYVSTHTPLGKPDIYEASALGLLNTLLDQFLGKRLAACFDDNEESLIVRFVEYPDSTGGVRATGVS